MILTTFDKKETYVTSEQADAIAAAIANGAKMIKVGDIFVAAGAIATITKGGEPPRSSVPRLAAPEPTTEEIEAKQARRREQLAAMKQDLIRKGVFKA